MTLSLWKETAKLIEFKYLKGRLVSQLQQPALAALFLGCPKTHIENTQEEMALNGTNDQRRGEIRSAYIY